MAGAVAMPCSRGCPQSRSLVGLHSGRPFQLPPSLPQLIPATRSSMQLALPEEGPEEEARRRLDERLQLFCLVERKVKGGLAGCCSMCWGPHVQMPPGCPDLLRPHGSLACPPRLLLHSLS